MENPGKSLLLGMAVLMVLAVIGCTQPGQPSGTGSTIIDLGASQELKQFSSKEEIINYLQLSSSSGAGMYSMKSLNVAAVGGAPAPIAESARDSSAGGGGGAADYSQTNVQVQGVDEADIVKNDGKYIYTLSGENLVIVEAYPAESAKILSETHISGQPQSLFLNKDRLVVFTQKSEEVATIPEYDYMPRQTYTTVTHALVFDISDRENPKKLKDYNVEGNYFQARMVGDYVYFVSNEYVYYYSYDVISTPVIRDSSEKLLEPTIYYFDNPEYNHNFYTIAAFDINGDTINAKTFLMGYANTLYMSEDNIYVAYQKNLSPRAYEEQDKDRFFEVIMPLFPADIKNMMEQSRADSSLNDYQKWDKISGIMEEYYNNLDKNDKEALFDEMEDAVAEYDSKREKELRQTVIHKIRVDGTEIEYVTRGEVPGSLLNQFSMDENDGKLRVATTLSYWTREESVQYNNVYTLGSDMKTVGRLEEIAKGESIYSTRFIGDRLYMVTFKRIDPLFVIDLSQDTPKILGELKIPGFSDYLHPYDETHIIGIGKETAENEWGGTSIKGVKLALFDVTDVAHPKQIDSYEIGTSGTDSEALYDHKAFLFDKEKNLLVIPVSEVKETDSRTYRSRVWQGAYVFNLDLNGFTKKGKITHRDDEEISSWYYMYSPYAVRRSLFMDDVLYTISAKKIKMNDLNDITNELNELDLPYEQDSYYPYPLYW